MDPDPTAPTGAVRSGSALLVGVAFNDKSRRPLLFWRSKG